ncbi:MAG: MotA/TolQ/ExbB proton channel family protein [bacterium]
MSYRKCMKFGGLILFLVAFRAGFVDAQPLYDIQMNPNIERIVKKNFLGIPKSEDITLAWRVMENTNGTYQETAINKLFNYEVYSSANDSSFASPNIMRPGQVGSVLIPDLKMGETYYFRVQAIDQNNQLYHSNIVWVKPGRAAEGGGGDEDIGEVSWTAYIPFHGRFPLTLLGQRAVYDRATLLGKAAFWVIWWFMLVGILIWIACIRVFSLGKIFPMSTLSSFKLYNYGFQYDSAFQHRKNKEFFGEDGIIHSWKKVIESTAGLLDKPPKLEGDKSLDFDRLRTSIATWWRDVGRIEIQKLQKDIDPYCDRFSTARIIRAGLANHEINGYKFMEASSEVDRAIENRAMMEIEQLKGRSKLEWLWNLGALAPLIGLFGTVTGISVSFQNLATQSERGIVDASAKITQLAGGINEALWTTIFGLTAGILLTVLYYVFKSKMDWVYGKWEEIYVDVSEKL